MRTTDTPFKGGRCSALAPGAIRQSEITTTVLRTSMHPPCGTPQLSAWHPRPGDYRFPFFYWRMPTPASTTANSNMGAPFMLHRRLALIVAAALLLAGSALAQTKLPPLRTGVDGTFAPHALPKLGGGAEGFHIHLFTEAARRLKPENTIETGTSSPLF